MFIRDFYVYFIFTLTLFLTGFIINIFQVILLLIVKPFDVNLFRKINYYLCYTFYSHILYLPQWYAGTEIILYMDEKDRKYLGKEHAYFILNHKYEIDWLCIGILSGKYHVSGNYKACMKKVIKYLPGIGWSLYLSENIFLERSFDKDKEIIQKQIDTIFEYADPIWYVFCPEGTRFTPEKYEASLKIAKEKGLPELKHHLSPRTKGFITSLPPIKGKKGAIYDTTITFNPDNKQGTLLNVFKGRKSAAHIHIRRIPFEEVPEDEKEASQFLHDIFVEKDKLQESFLTTGDYFATSGVKKVDSVKLKKSWLTLINHISWTLLIMGPIFYNLIKLLYTGTLYKICTVYGLLILFSFALSRVFGASELKYVSTYGNMKRKQYKTPYIHLSGVEGYFDRTVWK